MGSRSVDGDCAHRLGREFCYAWRAIARGCGTSPFVAPLAGSYKLGAVTRDLGEMTRLRAMAVDVAGAGVGGDDGGCFGG